MLIAKELTNAHHLIKVEQDFKKKEEKNPQS